MFKVEKYFDYPLEQGLRHTPVTVSTRLRTVF